MRLAKTRNGFTLIATSACLVTLFGMLGLALDLGRVYIAKSETQSFTDTAALAAAMALSPISFAGAAAAATGNTQNHWNLGTTIFTTSGGSTTIGLEYAKPQAANDFQADASTWSAAPPTAVGYTFVRVTASATLPLYILPVVGTAQSQVVQTFSVAAQVPLTSFSSGLLPFSPIQHAGAPAIANPPFGLVVGNWYTLRYPGGAKFTETDVCPGDQGDAAFLDVANTQVSDERGFYQNPQASIAYDEIVSGIMQYPVTFPGSIFMSGGAMNTAQSAINTRIDYDTDNVSTTYEQYQANIVNGKRVGNGFRLVGAPINAGPIAGGGDRPLVGFGGFFLSNSSSGQYYSTGGGSPWCAEYYGVWSKGGQGAGPGKAGLAYVSVLVQ